MSAVNKALSQLVDTQQSTLDSVERAQVMQIKSRPVWVWIIAGFGLSLAVGGWAVSQQAIDMQSSSVIASSIALEETSISEQDLVVSPTQKTHEVQLPVYRSSPVVKPHKLVPIAAKTPKKTSQQVSPPPVSLANNTSSVVTNNASSVAAKDGIYSAPESSFVIEQVELSPEKLADKAISRANKAMDVNDFQNAVNAYSEALRYTPQDESVRQKLAALYYGKGDARKAFDLLQRGIEINPDGEAIRISLSKFLVKENQPQAALSPLVHLPPSPTIEYLSLRAVLAQKSKQNAIALESYQTLSELDTNNARWWLGLAIQQERSFLLDDAKSSYQNALTKVGVSTQSQAFIRDRLEILKHLEESGSGN